MPYCHACGSELEESAHFCSECGSDQQAPHRARAEGQVSQAQSSLEGRTGINALIGGTVGFVVGLFIAGLFMPLYVVGILFGGAVGGFLQHRGGAAGAKVGTLAGLVATAPAFLLIVMLGVIGISGIAMSALGHFTPGHGGLGLLGIVVLLGVLLVMSTITNLLFGALGGALGGAIAEE